MKKYFVQLIFFTTTILALFVAFNWIIDPYWINNTPKIKYLNLSKPAAGDSRPFEIISILQKPPQALILGTSREDSGIDPKHPVFHGQSVFNAAIPAQPLIESKEILLNLAEHNKFPRQIVFGLYFENANVFYGFPADYTKDNFNESRPFKLLFSLSTLKLSAKTAVTNLVKESTIPIKDGFRSPDKWADQLQVGQHKMFKDSERNYLFYSHFPLPFCKSALTVETENGNSTTPMQELRDAVSIAYRMKSDMRLFIGPSHARQWETIYASGLWVQFEDWKHMVVKIVESEAEKANATPFQVWDFSGYNSVTEEDVPSLKDINKRMHYYYDSSHYTPAAGDLVLDRIFNFKSPERIIPNDFGALLTSHNIDSHLNSIRVSREKYRQSHPEDVSEIEALASDVAKVKRCKTQSPQS